MDSKEENPMNKPTIQIRLTPEQKEQVRRATGKEVTTLKLQPLEDRFAPALMSN
jgi:hypothetical protein